ncbi:MAG: hypothetical protein NZM65_07320 [Flavobacteriales bacterium]|nr:hypothetical protein [Flavobacteriales bacterium]MDW8410483.1 inositol monophosphatase family protein [Flavobacteriales bacterium]
MFDFGALKVLPSGQEAWEIVWQASMEAGLILMDRWRNHLEVHQKADESPVTEADWEAQRVLNRYLQKTGIPVIGEENSLSEEEVLPEVFWLTDPLDGTKGYIKGRNEFSVNIALIHNGVPRFGMIYAPALGVAYAGMYGQGAWKWEQRAGQWTAKPLKELVFDKTSIQEVTLVSNNKSLNSDLVNDLSRHLENQRLQVVHLRANSAIKFGWLAEGRAHLYPRENPCHSWDLAAGQALLESLGGQVLWPPGQDCAHLYKTALFMPVPVPLCAVAHRTVAEQLLPDGWQNPFPFA